MKTIFITLFLGCVSFIPNTILAADWDNSEKALMASFVLGQAVNYGQTNYIINDSGWEEMNSWIPEDTDSLMVYKAGTTLAIGILAHFLPHKWRKRVLLGSNLVVWGFVAHDFTAGVRLQF